MTGGGAEAAAGIVRLVTVTAAALPHLTEWGVTSLANVRTRHLCWQMVCMHELRLQTMHTCTCCVAYCNLRPMTVGGHSMITKVLQYCVSFHTRCTGPGTGSDPFANMRPASVAQQDPQAQLRMWQLQQLEARSMVLEQQAKSAATATSKTQREVCRGVSVLGPFTLTAGAEPCTI